MTKFKCIFCQNNLNSVTYDKNVNLSFCNNCPVQVNFYFNNKFELIKYGLLVNAFSFPRFLINLNPTSKELSVEEIKELSIEPINILQIKNAPMLKPKEANSFIKRILKQRAFL